MSIIGKLGAKKSKLAARKTVGGHTFTGRKAGLRAKLQTKVETKIRQKFGLPAARCGGLTIKDELKARARAKAQAAGRSGVAAVNLVGGLVVAGFIGLCLFALLAGGCASQPSRAQTMIVRENTINVYLARGMDGMDKMDATSGVPAGAVAGDVLCQAMMIETGGDESNVQDAAHSQQLNLPMGDTAVGALGELVGSAITGALRATKKDAEPAAPPAVTP